ncbi:MULTISPECIES: LysM peptidoglycan-binding domain-containing protein [Legionella]|uniref:LysM peptidoglycan-binding domain-containing protein n=1 Tax=Legionella septentrionalis TaxID=2498109 RepID=A0A3S0VBM0_9GAMM|nr:MULTISPECIES: LysM peptidoglycan-binding domain-containing protein [Legionella]MCP0913984.1 LysM peptidoglycan-binding domain-containing protein [Legionella sp. 27cVA30]RUQ90360.1 LysM peptidoglycan-binding domain-containing protein [Legionella septentrionalis]RUR00011.1 LysM peptidoglycan-binding domain-containing protein [Legionella septentrionalis]RUR10707.1 LysM peptidoglycan-binding domain-containing protein [Legionella septentrionalis]RUR16540.1 LysM peptidoglycan-binding domain-conta
MRYKLLFICLILFVTASHSLTLRSNAPARYVVQPGDTLWDIANRYLAYPWEWKALWHANPQIKNPDRLYPGAVLELRYHQRNPYLRVLSNGTVKLSPYMRPMPLEEAIPPIPLSDIKPFLDASLVLDRDTLTNAPFVLAFTTEHMLGSQGDNVYVKNLCPPCPLPGATFSYALYRPCGEYRNPVTKCFLGYKANLVAYAELVRGGDPATILLTDIIQAVELKDRVMPRNYPEFDLTFEPKTPSCQVRGMIIDLPGDYSQGAVGLVVVIDKGKDAGLQAGDVLGVYSEGGGAPNPRCTGECVKLPPERIGEVMVFRTFTRTSFALVVRSIRAINIMDTVTNP